MGPIFLPWADSTTQTPHPWSCRKQTPPRFFWVGGAEDEEHPRLAGSWPAVGHDLLGKESLATGCN